VFAPVTRVGGLLGGYPTYPWTFDINGILGVFRAISALRLQLMRIGSTILLSEMRVMSSIG